MKRSSSRVVAWTGGLLCLAGAAILAQETPPKPAAPAAPAVEKDPAKAMAALVARRNALGQELEKLRKEHMAADAEGKQEIEQQFDEIVADFQNDYFPRMVKAALPAAIPAYVKDAKNADAEYVVLGYLQSQFVENNYAAVIAASDPLIEKGRKNGAILNFNGVSHFAVHDFAKAAAVLKEAEAAADAAAASTDPDEKRDAAIFQQLGARYLPLASDYEALWEKEQKIRAAEAAAPAEKQLPQVLFKTDHGDITLELFENEAPNTVANFISLVEKKKYDGIAFHRVIPTFMAQGGDPNTLDNNPGNDGSGGPGYRILCECGGAKDRMHFQGSLSMAHAGKDTGGSQFFLTHLPTDHLNGKHTVFGRIVKGLNVAAAIRPGDKIVTATVIRKRNHPYVPKTLPEE